MKKGAEDTETALREARAAGWKLDEAVSRQRLREQGKRSLAENLAEGPRLERVPVELHRRRSPVSRPARLRELIEQIAGADVDFVVVGGLAVNAWGHLRGTRDVDIVRNPDAGNLDRLTKVLERLGGRVEVAGGKLAAGVIGTFLKVGDRTLVATELGPVDVLQGLPQVPRYADLCADAVAVDLGGTVVRVCSLEALLAMKRASPRPRDREDVAALEEANRDD